MSGVEGADFGVLASRLLLGLGLTLNPAGFRVGGFGVERRRQGSGRNLKSYGPIEIKISARSSTPRHLIRPHPPSRAPDRLQMPIKS